MNQPIYLDFAAATPTDPRVAEAMQPYQTTLFANPSSLHTFGRTVADKLHEATTAITDFLHCQSEEVIFTSSGTESNNLAVIGVAKANQQRGRHIVTTAIEHPSIINACRILEKEGYQVTYLPVTNDGLVETSQLQAALRSDTVLVSIHLANSELGVIQNIPELSSAAKQSGAYFHSDACQAAAYIDLDTTKLGVDLLTFNGSKMYGPKGVAALFVRSGVEIFPIMYGGGQQQSLRSGTENVPGIIGLATACQIARDQRRDDSKRIALLRDGLQQQLERLSGITINVSQSPRLPNHLSVTFKQTAATNLVEAFDQLGVAVSSGSACSSKSLVDSQVLQAIGLTSDQIHKTVRISLGRPTTDSQIKQTAKVAEQIIEK